MFKKILATLALLLSTAIAMAATDVNKATEAELDSVKGIGPTTSKLIMSERKKGDFKSWQDFIDRVKGIGDARAAKLSAEGLTVNGEAYKAAAAKKDDKKDTKAAAKEEKAEAKAKEAKAEDKKDAKEAKAEAKKDAKEAKAEAKKEAASAKK